MHVISRRVDEGLIFGKNIRVTVVEVNDDHVRLGISEPDANRPYREETVYLKHALSECELQLN